MKQILSFAIILICGAFALSCSRIIPDTTESGSTVTVNYVKGQVKSYGMKMPQFLKQGDTIAIFSPSSVLGSSWIVQAENILRGWGLVPVRTPHLGESYPETKYNLGGSPEHRAEDIIWALENKKVKAMISANGGYGAIQLVEMIPYEMISAHPKWMIGFSDFSTVLSMCTMSDVMSIHGSTAYRLSTNSAESVTMLKNMLFGSIPQYTIPGSKYNCPGTASGMLVGGNLYTLCALCGSKADILDKEDIILFIEELDESMSSIDQLFNTILQQGKMNNIRGIVFGELYDIIKDLSYSQIEEILYTYCSKLGIPVCFGLKSGHMSTNYPLIMGAPVTLVSGTEQSTLQYNFE